MSQKCAALLTVAPTEGSVDESKSNDGGEDETGSLTCPKTPITCADRMFSGGARAGQWSVKSSLYALDLLLSSHLVSDMYHSTVLSHIISQLRPGADLSRVVLPTFILEPRSMLERITKCARNISGT